MSLQSFLETAARIARAAFEPQEFDARPMYGVGYVPVARPGDGEEMRGVDAPGDVGRQADEAHAGARQAWMLFAGAVVLAAVVDFAVLSERRRTQEGR